MILSRYSGDTPDKTGTRTISSGPLYPDVLEKIEKCDVIAWTRKCIADLRSMSFDGEDVRKWIIAAMSGGRYLGSEWCEGSQQGTWAACDAYLVTDSTWNEYAKKNISCEYYIKFCLNKNDTVLMTVSFHLS